MGRAIGVLATRYIWVGMVEGTTLGEVRMYPEPGQEHIDLKSLPVDEILDRIRTNIAEVLQRRHGRVGRRRLPRNRAERRHRGIAQPGPAQGAGYRRRNSARSLRRRRPQRSGHRDERRRRAGGRDRRHARRARKTDPRLVPGRRHRLRALSPGRRRLGGRPHGGDARPQGALLRLRRHGAPGRHHGKPRHAPALPRHGAGRSLRRRTSRRHPRRGVRQPLAPGAGRRHRHRGPPGRRRPVLHCRSERRFRGPEPAQPVACRTWSR